MASASVFDVFLSHGTPDKPWVETLAAELTALGLHPFLDMEVVEAGESFPMGLSRGLAESRFLVLILSPHSDRPWVRQEWAAFMAHHGPEGRILPVVLEPTEIPPLLAAVHRIDATDRDAARVAREIARVIGRPADLPEGDTRRLVLSQDLLFSLAVEGDELRVTDPAGTTRAVTPPWEVDNQFGRALHFYDRLTREPIVTEEDRADLFARATKLGSLLFGILFDKDGNERLRRAMIPGRPRPLITIRSHDDNLLSLPWELLFDEGSFLLRDARVDLARSTPGEVGADALLREPDNFLKLVVSVSAPEGSGLDYEGESYRITKALSEQCRFVPTELGTIEDLVETVRVEKPTVIHFSGHGAPGALVFEDDEGRAAEVSIHDLLQRLRTRIDGPLPPIFYLASCHGNDAGGAKGETSAARLHREGVPQVVGYDGPIVDELSTRAEVAFYRALAEGSTTRYAVRQAREALAKPFGDPNARHRPRAVAEPQNQVGIGNTHPFAWAQLVLYHRGPDHPLSLPAVKGARESEEALRRTFTGAGDRKVLSAGFIGRRSEMHEVRRRIRRGDRVFVFQGPGGLGKSTLAFQVLPMLQHGDGEVLALWCQEVEQQPNRLEGLVGQLLDFCRKRFGLDWEQAVYEVDRRAGDDSLQRFVLFLQVLLENVPRLVVYLDNLESLQVVPNDSAAEGDADAIGEWASEDLGRLWEILIDMVQRVENLYVVASCRYRNQSFAGVLFPVSPLPSDALFRLMSWFPALRRLCLESRVRLTNCLAGHPRAVEYAEDLLFHALSEHEDRYGRWNGGSEEWTTILEPTLPQVHEKLQADLLLVEIWGRVLTDRERRMLYRMTLLRRPWEWILVAAMGEEGESAEVTFATAERLRRTSLLEQMELMRKVEGGELSRVYHFSIHPTTAKFIRERFQDAGSLRKAAHLSLGEGLEMEARKSKAWETFLEAGTHLFQAEEYERAAHLLGPVAQMFLMHGLIREGLQILLPFLDTRLRERADRMTKLLGTLGSLYSKLGDGDKAIVYHEKALALARESGDRVSEVTALGQLGLAYKDLNQLEKAISYSKQALAFAREIGDQQVEGSSLINLGNVYARMGDMEESVQLYEKALSVSRDSGEQWGEATVLGNLASYFAQQREFAKAINYWERQLEIDLSIGNLLGAGRAFEGLGNTYGLMGESASAIVYFEKRLAIAREFKDREGEGNALGGLGIEYAKLGEIPKAVVLLEQAIKMASKESVTVFSMALAMLRTGS